MNEQKMTQDHEISLFDLWEKLRDGWRYVVGGTLVGLTGAGTTLMVLPPTYEAVAVIQVGQIGHFEQVGQIGQIDVTWQPVEPPAQAVERMLTPAFQRRVAESLSDQEWLDRIARSGATKDLAFQIVKTTTALIELRAKGVSPDASRKKVDAVIAQLIKTHGELAKSAMTRIRSDLDLTREKLASAERDLETLNKMIAVASVKDDRFTQLALITTMRIQKESETFSQRQIIMALETAHEAPATHPAKAIDDVFVANEPISPKKGLRLALGLISGLLAGVVALFFVNAWRRVKRGWVAKA